MVLDATLSLLIGGVRSEKTYIVVLLWRATTNEVFCHLNLKTCNHFGESYVIISKRDDRQNSKKQDPSCNKFTIKV